MPVSWHQMRGSYLAQLIERLVPVILDGLIKTIKHIVFLVIPMIALNLIESKFGSHTALSTVSCCTAFWRSFSKSLSVSGGSQLFE